MGLLVDARMQLTPLRRIVALFVVIGFLSVAMAAVSSGHLHTAQTPHSCALCQVSLTPFTTSSISPAVWPPTLSAQRIFAETTRVYSGPRVVCDASRAPPQA